MSDTQWDWLMVTWNNRSIGLDTLRDSLSLFESEQNAFDPTRGKHHAVFATRDVQDSIWLVARRLMQEPTIQEAAYTDYAGDYVRIKFYGGDLGTMQSLEYRSQKGWPSGEDWNTLRRLTWDRFPEE